jgi:hypothetical protein
MIEQDGIGVIFDNSEGDGHPIDFNAAFADEDDGEDEGGLDGEAAEP